MLAIYLKLLLTAIFWGGTFIAGRIVARDIDPFAAAFVRFAIASVLLVALTWYQEGSLPRLTKRQILPVVLLGMIGIFAYNVLFFKGMHYISAGRSALIVALNPVFISLLSAYFFHERLSLAKLAGIVLSVLGAIVVITEGRLGRELAQSLGIGDLYLFGCVAAWVAYSLIGKSVMDGLSPLASVMYSSVVGTVALLPPALFRGLLGSLSSYSANEWFSLFYLAIFGTVLGFLWYYEGIQHIGPMRASLFINFVPISAILLGFLMLSEPVTLSLLAGTILVSGGVYMTNHRTQKATQ